MEKLLNIFMAGQKIKEIEKPAEEIDLPIEKFLPEDNMMSIYDNGIEYAWVSKNNEQCISFITCRDYLQCAAWGAYNNTRVESLGLLYDTTLTDPKVDIDNLRLAIRYKDVSSEEFKIVIHNSLALINDVEKGMRINPSKLYYGGKCLASGKDIWVFKGDKTWMRSPIHISMYSLLVRVGTEYNGKLGWSGFLTRPEAKYLCYKDSGYLLSTLHAMKTIAKDKKQTLFAKLAEDNFPEGADLKRLHFAGIVQWSKNLVDRSLTVNWRNV